jgi:hypothetical protein
MMKFAPFLFLISVSVLSAETNSPASADLAQTAHRERFNVTSPAFGAVGDGVADDTVAIQAAFNACAAYNTSTGVLGLPPGGIVEFPGGGGVGGFYVISGTINAYDGCLLEGGGSDANKPTAIKWNGPAVGAAYSTTAFTAAANASPYTYTAAFPQITGSTQNRAAQNVVTFTGTNRLSANQWVSISGCTTPAGQILNRAIGQVASATSTSAVVAVPSYVTRGAFSDTCTLTTISVMFALDGAARFNQVIKDLVIKGGTTNLPSVGVLFGSRVDAGTRISNVWVQGMSLYGYYFANGGINIDFDNGWRCDGDAVTCIYWKLAGSDSFGIANGTEDNSVARGTSGALAILDNNACAYGNVHLTIRNVKVEVNSSLAPGMGVITMYDCPAIPAHQFYIDTENYWVTAHQTAPGINFTSFAMIPTNDYALMLAAVNSFFMNGVGINTTQRFVGLPALTRADIGGPSGIMPFFSYSISANSAGLGGGRDTATTQFIGDVNVSQLWQDGIKASTFLYSDPAFAALPNGTTLYAGQILAPPSYWSGSNGKRYAIDVVYQTGTTGTPNGGATTCTAPGGTHYFVCSSPTDLSPGQWIKVGSTTGKIYYVDATKPASVHITWTSGSYVRAISTPTALTFLAPVLGPEIQIPTKSAAAPTTLAWSQGDMEQNSGAAANGVAAWVNVADGTPGRWAGIPLGDSKGKIAASQLSSARSAQAFCAGTASSSTSLLLFGAGTAQTTCTQSPGPQTLQQILLTTAGSLSNLAVRCGHQGSQPSSGTFSVLDLPSGVPMTNADSGTNTGLTVTIGNSPANANKTLFDTLHRFNYDAGDMIRIQFTTQADETLADCTASVNY